MKPLSLQLGQAIVMSLALTITLASAQQQRKVPVSHAHTERSFEILESVIEHLQTFGETVADTFYSLIQSISGLFICPQHTTSKFNYDVTLVGFVNSADGIGRHPILFKECLENKVKINFLSTRNIAPDVEDSQLGLPRLNPANKNDIGAVSILTDILGDQKLNIYKLVPESIIKIAYTMFESTCIPNNWASILNDNFDMAVVPDQFLVDIYKKCGVKIPIFVLPLPLILNEFLKLKQRTTPHKPFVFGMSGGFWKRKNHMRVLEAFAAEFGNRSDVKLRLHGRFGQEDIIQALADKIREYNLTNVELIVKPYNWDEYIEFFKSLDCYAFLSMGEGFSITPREALACGKPCILSDNTAHNTICDSGCVRVVPSNIPVSAFYDCHYDAYCYANYGCAYNLTYGKNYDAAHNDGIDNQIELLCRSGNVGYQFDCTTQDAQEAMRDVYQNYSLYTKKACEGRKWVKQYLHKNLCERYVSLVKPESIILGEENIIGDNFLMTNSKTLYEKYRYILSN